MAWFSRRLENRLPVTHTGDGRPVAGSLLAAVAVAASLIGFSVSPAAAAGSRHGQPMVDINPGGGVMADGSDGLHVVLNGDSGVTDIPQDGGDQLFYGNTYQYCCGSSAPMLNIGGTLYGEASAAEYNSSASWTNLEVMGVTGSGSTTGGSGTGSGSAHLRYTVTHGGRDYVVDRMVSYTFPNNFMTDSYTIMVPSGNTELVKFYLGGDTAPGSNDTGVGVMLTEPVRTVYSVNPVSDIQIGFGEIPGQEPFDGATAKDYSDPYSTVDSGGDIGFVADTNSHDAGIMIQWNIGTSAGEYERALRHFVGPRGSGLTADFRESEVPVGQEATLDLQIVNTNDAPDSGLGYTFTLPAGLTLGSTTAANTCSGTLMATAGTSTMTLAGGAVNAADSCLVTVPVTAGGAGDFSTTSASVTSITGFSNLVGTDTVSFTTNAICPTDHGWWVVADQVQRLYGATLGRNPDNDGHEYWTMQRLHGMTALELAANLLDSSERAAEFGQLDNGQFVDALYQQVLGRAADTDGRAYWVQQLGDSLSRSALALYMSDSAENIDRTNTRAMMNDADALTCRLYETIFHRSPDTEGHTYWTGLLTEGMTAEEVATAMLTMPEATSLGALSNEAFVNSCYESALNRAADIDGQTYWATMASTYSRGWVAAQLANSLESLDQ